MVLWGIRSDLFVIPDYAREDTTLRLSSSGEGNPANGAT